MTDRKLKTPVHVVQCTFPEEHPAKSLSLSSRVIGWSTDEVTENPVFVAVKAMMLK
jgi:hypothetical protein